jgi:putative flippase GtrA
VSAVEGARLRRLQAFLREPLSPEWGLAGQGFRYLVCGGAAAVLYISATTVLHEAFAVPFQVALAIGFLAGLSMHFTLQRIFVWRHHERFALAMHHQLGRYLIVCAIQYGITALATSRLPALLGVPVEVAYLLTMASLTGVNFVVFRGRVFHPVPAAARAARRS